MRVQQLYSEITLRINSVWPLSYSEWFDFVRAMTPLDRCIFSLLNIHAQLYNGGFNQCYYNGYGQFSTYAEQLLTNMKLIDAAASLAIGRQLLNPHHLHGRAYEIAMRESENSTLDDANIESELTYAEQGYYHATESVDLERLLEDYISSKL